MRLREFEVNGFGRLHGLTATDLPAGLVVFQGRNEAGKSTLLEFFRTMLTGPPDNPDARTRALLHSGADGGRLLLDTAHHGLVSLTRRPVDAPPELHDTHGKPLPSDLLARLTGGINRELYAGIFGVGLAELHGLTLAASGQVRDALCGASFGTGLRAPRAVLAELEAAMAALFSVDGRPCAMDALLRRLEQLDADMASHRETVERYTGLQTARQSRLAHLEQLDTEREALEDRRRRLDTRLNVWQQWEEWRLSGLKLDRLPVPLDSLPPDAPRRLELLESRLEEAMGHTGRARQTLERARAALDAVRTDHDLAAAAVALKELGERKASCRNALSALPFLRDEIQRTEDRLRDALTELGTVWTMDRIRTVNRSVHDRETLNARAEELALAENARAMAAEHLERVRQAGEEAARVEREADLLVRQLPASVQNLDDTAREDLRLCLSALDESRERLARCETELKTARMDQQRALAPLHLLPGNASTDGLTRIAAAQDEALALAKKALECQKLATEAKEEADRARTAEDVSRRRFMRLRDRRDDLGNPGRAALDRRRLALRHLRRAADLLPVEEYNLREAEDALSLHMADKPIPDRNPWLMLLGFLLVLVGGAHVAALRFVGLTALELTPDLSVPLVAFHGYLILLAGLTFMAAGLPRKNPDAQRHALKAAQLRDRVETATVNMRQLRTDLDRLCTEAGTDSPEPARLDALEAELERAQEQCATNERLEEEMATHQQELEDLQAEMRRLTANQQRLAAEATAAQRRWQDMLERFGVRNVMHSPDSADNFFARVDMARAGVAVANRIHEELRELESRGPRLVESARTHLPPEALPAECTEATAEAVVRSLLEACRQADLAAEERAHAIRALELSGERMVREAEAEAQAKLRLEARENELEQSRSRWTEALRTVGLLTDADTTVSYSPTSARQTLRCMDDACALDAERRRLAEDLARQEQERDALLQPLSVWCERFTDRLGASFAEVGESATATDADPFTRLDTLSRMAENAVRAQEERTRLAAQVDDQTLALSAAETVETEARDRLVRLWESAGASSSETLLTICAAADERAVILRRQAELADQLRLAMEQNPPTSAEPDFTAFLQAFSSQERDALEQERARAIARLASISIERQEAEVTLREQEASLVALRSQDRMAERVRERENLAATIRARADEWYRLAMARHLLREARSRYEREGQPAVIRAASSLFAEMTAGRWEGILRSLDDESLHVMPSASQTTSNEPQAAELLSRGTQEQLHLALRLAHARIHAGRATPLPLLLDDVLVNFDPERARHAADALVSMTQDSDTGPGSQIFFFTCHPHITALLQRACNDVRVLELD